MTVRGPDGGLIGVALNRQRGEFSDDDVWLLNSLRRPVRRAAGFSARLLPPELRDPSGNPLLTPREKEVLQFAAEGYASKQIARQLGIEVRTVDNHLQHIYSKLGVSSRSAAVAYFRSGVRPLRSS
jgi:DNA-binding NarL/FixJ family response regulator